MRHALVAACLLAVAGCSAPLAPHPVGPRGCADKLAQALSSPAAPVSGAYACLSAEMMANATSAGVNSDADLQTIAAKEPRYTSYRFLGTTAAGFYVYELDGPAAAQLIEVGVDKRGLVASLAGLAPDPMPTP